MIPFIRSCFGFSHSIPNRVSTSTPSDHQSPSGIKINPQHSSDSSKINWQEIKERALQNTNLTSEIRITNTSASITVVHKGWWESAKAWLGYPTISSTSKSETVTHLRDKFDAYFRNEVMTLMTEIHINSASKEGSELLDKAEKHLQVITLQLKDSMSQTIQQAHGSALESLMALREQYAKPDRTPQVIVKEDGRVNVIKPAPDIENMIFAGGGVKGVADVSVYKAMEKVGILKNLKLIVGSSAGAIAASLIASGMTPADYEEASNSISVSRLLFGSSKNSQLNKTLPLAANGLFSGTYAADVINVKIVGSMKKFLRTQLDNELQKLSLNDYSAVRRLKENLQGASYLVTFEDLALLRKIDPSQFKELTIASFNATQQKEVYYSVKTAPKMCIAEAVRASMSLPLLYESLSIEGNVIEDAGVGSNNPTEVADGQSQTILLCFDHEGAFDATVYGPPRANESVLGHVEETITQRVEEFVTGNASMPRDVARDKQKLHDAGPNALDVYHGALETSSFFASQEAIHAAQLQAYVRMQEQLALRQNQAISEVFDDLPSAMKSMSNEELQELQKRDAFPIGDAARAELARRELARRDLEEDWVHVDEVEN